MEPDIERLLAEVEWVRRLAGVLVADAADADDVAQEAWLHALRGGAPRGRRRGWLAAIARNAARQRARREGRRRQLEPDGARAEALPPTGALDARAAAQRCVVDHVLALAEPYRRVVLLRWFEGLAPAAIAAREEVPLATVKTRLARALARLRARLDAEHGGRAGWVLLLAPLTPKAGVAGIVLGAALMGSKWIAGGVLAAAAVIGGILWHARDEVAVPPRDAGTQDVAAGGAEGAAAPAEAAETPGALVAVPQEGARAATPAAAATSNATMTLRVLDAASDAPVPDAAVFVAADAVLSAALGERVPGRWIDPVQLVLATGTEHRADERGELQLALAPTATADVDTDASTDAEPSGRVDAGALRAGERGMVVAHTGERLGVASFRVEEGAVVEVRVRANRALRFRTVDAAGAPVPDVPVGLRVGPRGAMPEVVVRTAGPAAEGAFEHFDALFGAALEQGPLALVLPIPGLDAVEVPITDAVFGGVVTLVVPPAGTVVVDVRDELGRPLDGELVELVPLLAGAGSDRAVHGRMRATARSAGGAATFERVGLGLELLARLQLRGRVETTLVGPTEAGEVVRATLRCAREAPVLIGRVVTPDGAPLASERGRVEIRAGRGETAGEAELVTDADGRFRASPRFALAALFGVDLSGPGRAIVRFPMPERSAEHAGEAVLELPLAPGPNDLGDVVVAVPPAAFRGVVVDADGAPVAGARVFAARAEDGRTSWIAGVDATSDAGGAFALRAELEPGAYRLHASAEGYVLPDPMPARPGGENLEIVLWRSATVSGRLLLAPGVAPDRLRVEVRSLELVRDWPSRPSTASDLPERSDFTLAGVYPGRNRLAVLLPGSAAPVLARELDVAPGANDAGTLDLTRAVHALVLAVRDPAGRAVPRGYAVVASPAAAAAAPAATGIGPTRRAAFLHGELRLLAPALPVAVEVRADGFLPLALHEVSAGETVVLTPGGAVDVRLPDDLPPLPESFELELVLLPADEAAHADTVLVLPDGRTEHPITTWWDDAGVAVAPAAPDVPATTVPLQGAGAYAARWLLRGPGGARRVAAREPRVELAPGDALVLAPDPAELARAVARLAGG